MSLDTKFQKLSAALMVPFAVATTTLPAIAPQEVQAGEAVRRAYFDSTTLIGRAIRASENSRCVGVVVSTNAEQEKLQSAVDISSQIRGYFDRKGVVSLVIPESGSSFAGDNHMNVCISGDCERYPLEVLSKKFLDGIIEKYRSSGNVASVESLPSMCHS